MRWRRIGAMTALITLCALVLALVMIIVHEAGHTLVSRLLGDSCATFVVYGHSCFGCNLYDSQRMTPVQNVAVNLGGVLFTMLLRAASLLVLAWRRRPRWLLAEVAIICFAGDLIWQFVQALQSLPVPAREPANYRAGNQPGPGRR